MRNLHATLDSILEDHEDGDFYITREVDTLGRTMIGEEDRFYYGTDPRAAWDHLAFYGGPAEQDPTRCHWVITRLRHRNP